MNIHYNLIPILGYFLERAKHWRRSPWIILENTLFYILCGGLWALLFHTRLMLELIPFILLALWLILAPLEWIIIERRGYKFPKAGWWVWSVSPKGKASFYWTIYHSYFFTLLGFYVAYFIFNLASLEFWLLMALTGNTLDYLSTKRIPFKEMEANIFIQGLSKYMTFHEALIVFKILGAAFFSALYFSRDLFYLQVFSGILFTVSMSNFYGISYIKKRGFKTYQELLREVSKTGLLKTANLYISLALIFVGFYLLIWDHLFIIGVIGALAILPVMSALHYWRAIKKL